MLDPTRRYPEEEENEPPKRRGGGPCTPQGKENSSKNGVTHGCRSHILVLADEKQEDLDALYDRWLRAYQPDSEAALELLEQFVINKWYLLRNERRFNQVEFQLSHFEYTKWDEGQHRIFQLTLRYKTAAERAASKAQHDLEDYFKNRRAEEKHRQQFYARERTTLRQAQKDSERREDKLEKQLQKAEAKGIALPAEKADLAEFRKRNRESFTRLRHELEAAANRPGTEEFLLNGQPSPKQLRNLNILEQSVEITIQDGLAVTALTPSNQQLLERAETMNPPPQFVYRRLHFPHGIPDEYDWTTADLFFRDSPASATQRLPLDTWLDLLETEAQRPGNHLSPAPAECLDSGCPACRLTRERLRALPLSQP